MEYRNVRKNEIDQVIKIKDYCFLNTYSGKRLEDFKYWAEVSTIIGAFDQNDLAGQIVILPLAMNIHGQQYQMGGIGFVATYPEYRNAGIMKQLIKVSLERMREQKQWVSVLGPFSVSFYRYFGWELFFDKVQYEVSMHQLPLKKENIGQVIRFDYNDKREYLDQVKKIYQDYALNTNGVMLRDEAWWKRLEMRDPDSSFALSIDSKGNHQGYIRYVRRGQNLILLDQVTLNIEAERSLWEFIKTHRSNFTTVTGLAAAQDSFGTLWDEPQFKQELLHDKMIRIVDVEQFLTMYPFKEHTEKLYLNVTDVFAPWNQGFYEISSRQVKKVMKDNVPAGKCLKMDISSLSSYLSGYQGLKWYHYHGKAEGSEQSLKDWEQAVPKERPRFYEHF